MEAADAGPSALRVRSLGRIGCDTKRDFGYQTGEQRRFGALNWHLWAFGLVLAGLSGCGPSYSPDTYASNAVQQANKVEQGIVVGVRQVGVSAAGTLGTVAGAAAGGIAGSQVGIGPASAITALGGSLVGGFAGSAAEHVSTDTTAFEYIVRKSNGDLVSVTQKDKTPLALGQKVLVIAGNQARVVPDYTLPPDVSGAKSDKAAASVKSAEPVKPDRPAADAKPGDTQAETPQAESVRQTGGQGVSPATTPQLQPGTADAKSAPDSNSAGNSAK
jgi:outer membrane lipoprotein SlyB